jgi:hypothetical protein
MDTIRISTKTMCGEKHFWIWSNSSTGIPQGYPCVCGEKLWNVDICPTCGQGVLKPKDSSSVDVEFVEK